MTWLIGTVVVAVVLHRMIRLARRRRELVTVLPGEPISTLHTDMSKKTSKERKAALDAATQLLR
jgi:hypothetical protein